MKEIWTIELNLDDDFSSSCAYHVDRLDLTIEANLRHAEQNRKTDRWVLIGLAPSLEEAHDQCIRLQRELCKRNNRTFKSLPIA